MRGVETCGIHDRKHCHQRHLHLGFLSANHGKWHYTDKFMSFFFPSSSTLSITPCHRIAEKEKNLSWLSWPTSPLTVDERCHANVYPRDSGQILTRICNRKQSQNNNISVLFKAHSRLPGVSWIETLLYSIQLSRSSKKTNVASVWLAVLFHTRSLAVCTIALLYLYDTTG